MKIKMTQILLFTLILLVSPITFADSDTAGTDAVPPCSTPEFHQYDFWLGQWELTWGEGDNAGSGTNIITAELGGCVIEENFSSSDEKSFIGNSLSVYDIKSGMWKQTWVDNSGAYLDFVGEFKDGEMFFWRTATKDGKEYKQRMVYFNIEENSLDWKWESSTDNGKTWKLLWQIHYQRKQQ